VWAPEEGGDDTYQCYAVHAYGIRKGKRFCKGVESRYNSGTRLNNEKMEFLERYLESS